MGEKSGWRLVGVDIDTSGPVLQVRGRFAGLSGSRITSGWLAVDTQDRNQALGEIVDALRTGPTGADRYKLTEAGREIAGGL